MGKLLPRFRLIHDFKAYGYSFHVRVVRFKKTLYVQVSRSTGENENIWITNSIYDGITQKHYGDATDRALTVLGDLIAASPVLDKGHFEEVIKRDWDNIPD